MEPGIVVDSNGYRVNVGDFDLDGLNINNWNDDENPNSDIGVASSRKFISPAPFYGAFGF